jgi:glycosyltransferase involved in cell wall biosynthesis
MLDHFCARLGADNVHVILVGRRDQPRPTLPYRHAVLEKPSSAVQARSVMRHVFLPALRQSVLGRFERRAPVARTGRRVAYSLQEAVLRSRGLARSLRAMLDEIDADLEVWDTLRVGQYAPAVTRRRRVLYADDLFSERYASLLREDASTNASPGGEFQKLLPAVARRWLGHPRVYRPLLRMERGLVAAAEERQPYWFDATYLVGAEETGRLRQRCPGATIETLPPLLRESRRLPRRPDFRQPNFTFIGGFSYGPNVDGIDWFLDRCRKTVLSALPDVRITVVGVGSERGLPSAAGWRGRVRFLGFVDDLDPLLAASVALLSPLRSGSGVKIKVLEALARGLPVIATPAGVQGIAAAEQSGCLVAATPEAFAACMVAACDGNKNAALGAAARRSWEERYSATVVRRRYDSLFGLGAERPPVGPSLGQG